MKSEHPDLPLTIARLARSATPVMLLEAPWVRLVRWGTASTAFVLVSIVILGVRADVTAQMGNGWFVARATATTVIAFGAAMVALLLSVPGVEPSRLVRTVPLAACVVWAVMLLVTLAATRSPLDVLLQVAPHPSCVLLIVATAMTPGGVLVRMLRHSAPLQARWTGALAGLASLSLGALGTQFVCTNDAAAHHLLWHFTPVVLFALAGVAVGSSLFDWPHGQDVCRRDVDNAG